MSQTEIMIVDDNTANLEVLRCMLAGQGHEVCAFPLGRLALAAAAADPPGLILLDINMPEMNGYEVCQRLKSSGELAKIPVIFLSALNETEDKVKAFQSGGVDYISKPFQFEEVQARVETHLSLHALRRALEVHNERLEEAVAARTRELSAALERLTLLDRSKSDFLNLISHEFRTPLNGILGIAEIILSSAPESEENVELQSLYHLSCERLLSILDDALLLTQIDVGGERFKSAPISLSQAVAAAIQQTTNFAVSRNVTFATRAVYTGAVLANEELLVKALHALLETAVKFAGEGTTVSLAVNATADAASVLIESHGGMVPEVHVAKFFDVFSIDEVLIPNGSLGVRPALAQRILALFGGVVSMANLDRLPGIRLTVSLQRA